MAKNSAGATSEFYFNFGDNSFLDAQGFTVFAVDLDALNPDGSPNPASTINLIHELTRVDVDPINDSGGGFSVFDNVPFTDQGEMVVIESIGGSGTVRGAVFNDLDQNGVMDAGEAGLAGVVIFSDANDNGTAEDDEFSTMTSVDGTYALVLPAGVHTIRQSAIGNTLQTAPMDPDFFTLDVEIGGEFRDIRFGSIGQLSVVINAAEIAENGGATTATISRNMDVSQALTVTLTSDDVGEATVPMTVEIPAGVASATFDVTAVHDAQLDGTQTVTITASAGGYVDGDDTLNVTDIDNAQVTIEDVTETEGEGLLLTVTLDNAVEGAFDVNVSLADVSATGGATPLVSPADYDNGAVTLNFTGAAGETQQFTVATLDDVLLEVDETFIVSLDATNAMVTDNDTATGTIASAVSFDFGDAPTSAQSEFAKSYPTTLVDNGAMHAVSSGLLLGVSVDTEPDGQPTAGADGDIANEDDEDGVSVVASIVSVVGFTTTSSFAVVASEAGKLDAWIDFNQDGDWDDDGEQIFASVDVSAGNNVLAFTVPAGTQVGSTAARFRISSAGGLSPTGAAEDGEVEDYIVTVLNGNAGADIEIDTPLPGTLEIVTAGSDIVVRYGETVLFQSPGSAISSLDIQCTEHDDTLSLANLDGIFDGPISADGRGGVNALRLSGSGQALDLTQLADGSIQSMDLIDISGLGRNSLTLDAQKVLDIASADTLTVRATPGANSVDDDVVDIGSGWTFAGTEVDNGEFVRILNHGEAVLRCIGPRDWTYPENPLDANASGSVELIDALIIINEINTPQFVLPNRQLIDAAGLDVFPDFFFDASPDGFVVPLDALLVINWLNAETSNAEGEAAALGARPLLVHSAGNMQAASTAERDDRQATLIPVIQPGSIRGLVRHEVASRDRLNGKRELADRLRAIDGFFADSRLNDLTVLDSQS